MSFVSAMDMRLIEQNSIHLASSVDRFAVIEQHATFFRKTALLIGARNT
jgi:hypothetical protein